MNWDELDFFKSGKLRQVLASLNKDKRTIFPPREEIFNALKYTPFNKVKVVLLGQDPYPKKGHAHGLAFSVKEGVKPLPPSLKNIFKELHFNLKIVRTNGSLIDWAQQGVLLLNTSLTVAEDKPQSHKDIGWDALTNEIITKLSEHRNNIVFILWGNNAISKSMLIDNSLRGPFPKDHLILSSAHPSPLSCNKGFFGSNPFSKTNEYLIKHNIEPIRW